MQTKFKITKFKKLKDGSFSKNGFDEYVITYLKSQKNHLLSVVVNDYLTKQFVDISTFKFGYRDKILIAIREYRKSNNNQESFIKNNITNDYIEKNYSKTVVTNIKNNLLTLNKECSRDRLTKYELIDHGNEDNSKLNLFQSIIKYLNQSLKGNI